MGGSEARQADVERLREAWAKAPPMPDLSQFITPDLFADESRLRELFHLDALERHRLGQGATLEHYQALLADRAPEALAPGTELARLLIRLELLMAGDAAGSDRIESLRGRLGAEYAGDVSIALRGAAPSMASPLHTHSSDRDEIATLDESAVVAGASLPRGERLGDWIGPYRLLDVIGEGGFGVVYHAQQREPIERHVALKLIKPGMDTRSVLARFESERQTLALLRHDHIAAIYDAGATERGRPYFVMELVRGEPITRYCDRHRLTTRERLELFIPVCRAVHHAHQKGIIHRDLSPDNILVEVRDGKPVPKIIDFGVARAVDRRLTERTMSIERGVMIGKPEYMSPEQAEMTNLDIDTTADTYSLGVILYEMLAGVLPLDRKTLRARAMDEMIAQIRYSERPTPQTRLSSLDAQAAQEIAFFRQLELRTLTKELGGRVQYLPMKALRADRTKRFSSAEALARDVEHYLKDEDFDEAAVEPRTDRMRRFVKRHRARVAASTLLVAALILGLTGTTWQAIRATRAESKLTGERNAALAARAQERKRAEELQEVADFQASQLSDIDTAVMGLGLRQNILDQRRAVLQDRTIEDVDHDLALRAFEESLNSVNFTNVALVALDQHILQRALAAIENRFADQPLVKARLLQTVADTLEALGLLERAMNPQEEALAIRRRINGNEHPETLSSISGLGNRLASLGRMDEAIPYYREALEGRRRVLGDEHPDTLTSISNLGIQLLRKGRFDEAMSYFSEALEASRRTLGDEHPITFQSIGNMGILLRNMGRLDEAMSYYREAMESSRRTFGDEHPKTLDSISNMGILLASMSRLDEAIPYYLEALEVRRRVLGDEHPDTLTSIHNVGTQLLRMGRFDEAMPYLSDALETSRRILGDTHPDTLNSISNMGLLLQNMRHFDEAMPYYREALENRRRILGDAHPDTLTSINNMGGLLKSMGRFDEAMPYLSEALDTSRRTLGDEHSSTLIAINNMGGLLRDLGQLQEAEQLGAEAVETAKRVLPEGHRYIAMFLAGHARTLAAMGRFAEAEHRMIESHAIFVQSLGPKHTATIGIIRAIIDLFDAWHAAEPEGGHDLEAAKWRARLSAIEGKGEVSHDGAGA